MAWHAMTSFKLGTAARGYQVECTMRDERRFRHTPWTCPKYYQPNPELCLRWKARLCIDSHILAGRPLLDGQVMQENSSAVLLAECESERLVSCQQITIFKEGELSSPFGGAGAEGAALQASALACVALAAAHFAALALRCPLRSARAAWRRARAAGLGRGPLDPKVREQFLGLRVQQVRRSMPVVRAVISLFALASSAELLLAYLDGRRWSEKTVRNRLYQAESLPVLLLSLGFGILDWLPGGVTPLSVNCVSIFLAAGWAWKYSLMTAYRYEEQQLWMLSVRLLQGLFLGNAPLQSFLMTAVTVVDVSRHSVLLLEHPDSYKLKQGGMCAVFAVVFWLFEANSWSLAKALVFEKRTARSHTLVHEELSAACDAVCSLDQDLMISAPSPQLAGLLLRQCRGTSLSGQSLADLMPPNDGERFKQEMAALVPAELITNAKPSTSLPRMAQAIHVCLRDANNSSVRMELFCSCILDDDDRRHYLVGIKEDREAEVALEETQTREVQLPAQTAAEGTAAWSAQLARVPENATALVVAATDSRVSSDEELSSLPSTSGDRPSPAKSRPHGEAHQVWLDTASPDLSILKCSAGFSALSTSGTIGHGFREWLNEPTFESIQEWVRTAPENSAATIALEPPSNPMNVYQVNCMLGAAAPTGDSGSSVRCLTLKIRSFEQAKRQSERMIARELYRQKCEEAPAARLSPSTEPGIWFDLADPELPVHLLHARGRRDLRRLLPADRGLAQALLHKDAVLLAAFRSVAFALVFGVPEGLPSDLGHFAFHRAGCREFWADFVLVAVQLCKPKLLVHVVFRGLEPRALGRL